MLTVTDRAEAGAWGGVCAESRRTRLLSTAHGAFLGRNHTVTFKLGSSTSLRGTRLSWSCPSSLPERPGPNLVPPDVTAKHVCCSLGTDSSSQKGR